jgi:hypothetical protein
MAISEQHALLASLNIKYLLHKIAIQWQFWLRHFEEKSFKPFVEVQGLVISRLGRSTRISQYDGQEKDIDIVIAREHS